MSSDYSETMNCTNSSHCHVAPQHISIIVLISLVFAVGFFLNIFSVWVFMCRTPEWRSGTILQFNLAISDAIVCPLAPFYAVYFAQGGNWPFGDALCKIKIVILVVHFYGSILFLTLISVHRYLSVVCHSRVSCLKQKNIVKKLCIGVWFVMLMEGVVYVNILGTSEVENRTVCLSIHQEQHVNKYFIINFFLLIPGFLIPFSISLFCYCRLAMSVSSINVCQQKGKLIRKKSRKMVAICLIIFGLCFMPMNVVRTTLVVVKKFLPCNCNLLMRVETAYYASWVLSSTNCCLDPLIYCFASQNFTRTIRTSLRKIGVPLQTAHQDEDNEQDSALNTHISRTAATENRETTLIPQS